MQCPVWEPAAQLGQIPSNAFFDLLSRQDFIVSRRSPERGHHARNVGFDITSFERRHFQYILRRRLGQSIAKASE